MRQDQRSGPRNGQRIGPEAGRRNDRRVALDRKPGQQRPRQTPGPASRLSGLSAEERQLYDALASGEAWLHQRPLDGHWLLGRRSPAATEVETAGEDGGTRSFDYVAEETVWALMDRQLVDRNGRAVPDRQRSGPQGGPGQRPDTRSRQETTDALAAE